MNKTVYISNLSYKRDQVGLKNIFSRYGRIANIKIIVEPKTKQSRGMAFVEMGTAEEAKKAIQGLDGALIDGRTIKAKYATPMKKTSAPRFVEQEKEEKVKAPEISFKEKQLAKKARNSARKTSNPFYAR